MRDGINHRASAAQFQGSSRQRGWWWGDSELTEWGSESRWRKRSDKGTWSEETRQWGRWWRRLVFWCFFKEKKRKMMAELWDESSSQGIPSFVQICLLTGFSNRREGREWTRRTSSFELADLIHQPDIPFTRSVGGRNEGRKRPHLESKRRQWSGREQKETRIDKTYWNESKLDSEVQSDRKRSWWRKTWWKMKIDIEKTMHGEEIDPRSFLVVECAASSEQNLFVELRKREIESETTL